jgi:hypothetical protein
MDPLGVVHLKGDILMDPSAVAPAFRPSQELFMPAGAVSGAAHLFIEPDGDVTPPTSGWWSWWSRFPLSMRNHLPLGTAGE